MDPIENEDALLDRCDGEGRSRRKDGFPFDVAIVGNKGKERDSGCCCCSIDKLMSRGSHGVGPGMIRVIVAAGGTGES